jgi:hypothetical protein
MKTASALEAEIAQNHANKLEHNVRKVVTLATIGERLKAEFIKYESDRQLLELSIIERRSLVQGIMLENEIKQQQVSEARSSANTALLNYKAQEITMKKEFGDAISIEDRNESHLPSR